jgi:hypothetical protein
VSQHTHQCLFKKVGFFRAAFEADVSIGPDKDQATIARSIAF